MMFFVNRHRYDTGNHSSAFPYTLDDMGVLDIDILLKQPTLLVLADSQLHRDVLVQRILDNGTADLPSEVEYYLVQVITASFLSQHLRPLFFSGHNQAVQAIQQVYSEAQKRLEFMRRTHKELFPGIPIYLLLDCFTELQKRKYEDVFGQLIFIMTCARQINIHTIVFEHPDIFHSTDDGFFSSFVMTENAYRDKYRSMVPKGFRNIETGTFYIQPHFGDKGIYTV